MTRAALADDGRDVVGIDARQRRLMSFKRLPVGSLIFNPADDSAGQSGLDALVFFEFRCGGIGPR
jgi:hypothetical protein